MISVIVNRQLHFQEAWSLIWIFVVMNLEITSDLNQRLSDVRRWLIGQNRHLMYYKPSVQVDQIHGCPKCEL